MQLAVNIIHGINILAATAAGFWPSQWLAFTVAASLAMNTYLETLIPQPQK